MEVTRSIRSKLVVILALCALLFVLLSAPFISYFSYINYKNNANLQQARLVEAVKVSASIAAFVKNEEIANDVLKGLLLDDEILRATLKGTDNFSIEIGNAEAEQALPDSSPTEYPLYSPIKAEQQIGSLFVWANDELITERAIGLVKKSIAWLAGISCLLAFALIWAANKLVGSPLRRLAREVSGRKPGTDESIAMDPYHKNDEIGLVAHSVNNFLGVTCEALHTERTLRHQIEKLNRHYRNIFASTHVGILVLDENGFLLHNNPVLLQRIIKLDKADQKKLLTEEFFSLVFKEPDEAWNLVAQGRKQGETVSADLELKAGWKEPGWVHCLISGSKDKDTNEEIIEAVLYDVTHRIEEASLAQKMAEEDPLTGLKNRRGCERYFEERMDGLEEGSELTAMLLDLDGFKPVNDVYGHARGDEVLRIIAERISACVRASSDFVGRFGGDEFVVMIESESEGRGSARRVAKNLIEALASPVSVSDKEVVSVGVSIGIAFVSDYPAFDDLLQAADKAMYKVKSNGKNNFAFAPGRSDNKLQVVK